MLIPTEEESLKTFQGLQIYVTKLETALFQ